MDSNTGELEQVSDLATSVKVSRHSFSTGLGLTISAADTEQIREIRRKKINENFIKIRNNLETQLIFEQLIISLKLIICTKINLN